MNNTIKIVLLIGALIILAILFTRRDTSTEVLPIDEALQQVQGDTTVDISAEEQIVYIPGTYAIAPEMSTLSWSASMRIGLEQTGTIQATKGSVVVTEEGSFTRGEVLFPLDTLQVTSIEPGNGKEKLEEHLRSADFFNVTQFPNITYNILSITPTDSAGTHEIDGSLQIKNIKYPFTSIAIILPENESLRVNVDLTLDRTQFGIVYGSENFFDLAKDSIIEDVIDLQIDLLLSR